MVSISTGRGRTISRHIQRSCYHITIGIISMSIKIRPVPFFLITVKVASDCFCISQCLIKIIRSVTACTTFILILSNQHLSTSKNIQMVDTLKKSLITYITICENVQSFTYTFLHGIFCITILINNRQNTLI